jgi:hypothetical protein
MMTRSGARAGLMFLLALGLSACAADGSFRFAAGPPVPYPPTGYTHVVRTSAVELYWNCTQPEAGILRLEGAAFNPWGDAPVQHLELQLAGVDTHDRTVSQGAADARDSQIMTNQSSPFALDVRTTGREVQYDLYYQYQYPDGGRDGILLSGPMVPGAFPRFSGRPFLVRDACSPTQHLAH